MTEQNKCARAEDLVSYLYDEATADERLSFEQHIKACVVCRDELAAFGQARGAVREWREEIVSHAPALQINAVVPQHASNGRAAHAPASVVAPRRTAWAALREFFTLTPAWLRVGMVAASLVVCALAVLAITKAQFSWNDKGIAFGSGWSKPANQPQTNNAPQPAPQVAQVNTAEMQAEIARLTAERDAAQRDLAATRQQLDATAQQINQLNASLANSQAAYRQTLATLRTTRANQANSSRRGSKYGPQLAETDDEGLRLSDLLDEVNASHGQTQARPNEH